jgi:ABC-type transport system involved in multi-copper enzyme maturation permease subunit
MLNLILKDILIQKKTLAFLGLYIIIFSISFQHTGAGAFAAIAVAVTYQMVATACGHEEKAGSDIIWNSMPLSREKIVLSKYLSVFVYALLAALGYMAFTLLLSFVRLPFRIVPITMESVAAGLIGILLMNGIYFPVYFKLGYMKARVVSFVLFFVFFFGIMSLAEVVSSNQSNALLQTITAALHGASDLQILFVMIGAALIFMLISYALSVKLYNSREF